MLGFLVFFMNNAKPKKTLSLKLFYSDSSG